MAANPELPAPPTDAELYDYFGPQRRWVMAVMFASCLFPAAATVALALANPLLWPFGIVLILNTAAVGLSMLDGIRARRITPAGHQLLTSAYRPDAPPSVDVLLPTCGEPVEVLANTYRYVAALAWDGPLGVLVLDELDREEVRELAARHGFAYVHRPDPGVGKKAGNLNHGLGRSEAEFVVVFDADFCPRPDFLHHLMPYTAEPSVAIVQSPQVFDTGRSMGWLQRTGAAAQEQFYRWLQPARDADDVAVCCGSNAVYRRSALDRVGGFVVRDHSEDLYTGLALYRLGLRTVYVPLALAKGLSPDTLEAFLNQQYRWCLGNLELARPGALPGMGLPWRAQLGFWAGISGYIMGVVNIWAVPLPMLIVLAWQPDQISPVHLLPFLVPIWTWGVLLPLLHRSRTRLETLRAGLLSSFAHLVALRDMLGGKAAEWVPTGARRRANPLVRTAVNWVLLWTGGTLAAMWALLAYDVAVHGWERLWGAAVLIGVHTYLAAPVVAAAWGALRRRGRARPEPNATVEGEGHEPQEKPVTEPPALVGGPHLDRVDRGHRDPRVRSTAALGA
ncbi:glycosyltransferase family 2 protein [Glycomyces algeriensis]|nr:glycosyltransferase family 2 protein [Glycomyces algeriensis]MDA1365035.1 glycosyltransferase [Glycomyces algeriensis]MDR7349904.1 cellulose synthase (UDP-forming) [Glycomyces algeriensis]